MSLTTIQGTFEKAVQNAGSRSEHEGIRLITASNETIEVRVRNDHPFSTATLDPYVGKKVSVNGTKASGNLVFIDSLNDISIT